MVVQTSPLVLVSVSSSVPVQLWLNPTTVDSCGQNPVLDMCVGCVCACDLVRGSCQPAGSCPVY